MLYDYLDQFKFEKKEVNLFEAFAGVGSQAKALGKLSKELGIKVNNVGISEFDKHCIKSYESIHGQVNNYGDIIKIEKLPDNIDIFTYSFPCQDLSLAGKGAGIKKDTRSGLLYEVERLAQVSNKPKVLLMENVENLVGKKNKPNFDLWVKKLESMGYSNYWKILNAKNYGIPQSRNRVFMISIYKDTREYTFPEPFELKLKLKDFLEDKVDDKYFLSDKMIKQIFADNDKWGTVKKTMNKPIAGTITTREGQTRADSTTYITDKVYIKEATKKGYAEAEYGDSINISYPNSKTRRGRVGKQVAQTLTTSPNIVVLGNRFNCNFIRKLTPLEYWRLMGFDDEDFYSAKNAGVSDSQLYKQAGNSIVVDVLYHIFKKLF